MISKAFEDCPVYELSEKEKIRCELQKRDKEVFSYLRRQQINEARIRNANNIVETNRGSFLFNIMSK